MKVILKPILEWLTGRYVLLENVSYSYITMATAGPIAFAAVWNIVDSFI